MSDVETSATPSELDAAGNVARVIEDTGGGVERRQEGGDEHDARGVESSPVGAAEGSGTGDVKQTSGGALIADLAPALARSEGPHESVHPNSTTGSFPANDTKTTPEPPSGPITSHPPPPRRRRLPPPPAKGILRPPQSSHAASSRFSFRRDILQPFNSSYVRASGVAEGHASTAGGNPPAGTAGVGEAVGNAAATAGGFFGNALKKLSAAAAAAGATTIATAGQQPAEQAKVQANGIRAETPTPDQTKPLPQTDSNATTSSVATTSIAVSTASPAVASPLSSQQPAPPPQPSHPLPVSSLKLVRFRMSSLKVVYPINHGTLEAIAPEEEGVTRDRIEEEFRAKKGKGKGKARVADVSTDEKAAEEEKKVWTGEELGRLYAECCRTREEPGIERVKRAFRENSAAPPKSLDLSHEFLSHGAIEALSDVLSVDWGCKKLVLEGCGLDDESIKPVLHALLVSASIPTVSLAGNKRIRNKGWKMIAVFLRKAKFLRYLDLSETSIDRRAAEWLVQAITPQPVVPPSPLQPSLPASPSSATGPVDATGMKELSKKVGGLWDDEDESDAEEAAESKGDANEAIRSAEGAPADEMPEPTEEVVPLPPRDPLFDTAPLLKEDWSSEPSTVLSLRIENCGLRGPALEVIANGIRSSQIKHVSLRRNRINAAGGVALAAIIRDYPVSSDPSSAFAPSPASVTPFSASLFGHSNGSSDSLSTGSPAFEAGNSVTARQLHRDSDGGRHRASSSATLVPSEPQEGQERPTAMTEREVWRLSEARARLRKQIDGLPRIGALLTLDVKGNDIRNGVTYIAQVLKRNRTLKVLNLSENRIDSQGLIVIGEALKYNTALETLDVSHNPCCGPTIDGIMALRSAMMVSPTLKRVFLNSTDLTSEGAIALAEFLPEARSILHLDLTSNQIDISGVMALAVSIKLNSTIRCLDLNIPFDDPDFSRFSQEILLQCVRNTELAQVKADEEARAAADGSKRVVVAQPIRNSALASSLEARHAAEERQERRRQAALRTQKDIFAAAAETRDVVAELLAVDQQAAAKGIIVAPSEVVRDALLQVQLCDAQLAEAFTGARQGEERERAEVLLTELSSLLDLAKSLYDKPPPSPRLNGTASPHLQVPENSSAAEVPPPSSPTFSLQGSDSEDEAAATTGDGEKGGEEPDQTLESGEASSSSSPIRSPIQSESRAMVMEESEVFRKGVALGVDDVPSEDEDEEGKDGEERKKQSEVSGEELRKEILETPVTRSPRTSFSEIQDKPRMNRRASDLSVRSTISDS
ncbi:leucine-rich repeat containing protein 68 [Rhodotorula toruloides]|uniref:Leucine-rich repeat containing protein 68 n=1 Tax=Rhodotorula toruloides TaxID=5286 RepID=A0A511KBQ1_RHOTO|nr:leucine-rich repeat containing protein 68 [Rhodotorula toruloides]